MGMWLASHDRLGRYLNHSLWEKKTLLETRDIKWGYAEKSNSGLLFVDVPAGFQTTNLVPYDPIKRTLFPEGQVSHERNGYSALKRNFASVNVEDVLNY